MWKGIWVGFWSHPCSMEGLEKAFLSLLVDFVITRITQIWGNQDLFKIVKNWISSWEHIIFLLLNGSHQIVPYLLFFFKQAVLNKNLHFFLNQSVVFYILLTQGLQAAHQHQMCRHGLRLARYQGHCVHWWALLSCIDDIFVIGQDFPKTPGSCPRCWEEVAVMATMLHLWSCCGLARLVRSSLTFILYFICSLFLFDQVAVVLARHWAEFFWSREWNTSGARGRPSMIFSKWRIRTVSELKPTSNDLSIFLTRVLLLGAHGEELQRSLPAW